MLDKNQLFIKTGRLGLVLCVLSLLGACATTVTITADIPKPLVQKLPLNAKLIYSKRFSNYAYTELEKDRSLKKLTFGEAQKTMFNQVFSHLLNLSDDSEAEADVSIAPELLDFQYSAPGETKLKLYEVFLKYRLKLADKNQQELADWTIKGYGKTPAGSFTSPSTAFNAAANVALRDVGAQLAIRFPQQSSITALLPPRENEPTLPAAPPAAQASPPSAANVVIDKDSSDGQKETGEGND